jgi:hypothetical protein
MFLLEAPPLETLSLGELLLETLSLDWNFLYIFSDRSSSCFLYQKEARSVHFR